MESVTEIINSVEDSNNVGTVTVTGAETTPVATTEQFEYEISQIVISYGECPVKLVIWITCININIFYISIFDASLKILLISESFNPAIVVI